MWPPFKQFAAQYAVAHRELTFDTPHYMVQYASNKAEPYSPQPTPVRNTVICRFEMTRQAHQYLTMYGAVYNLFNLGGQLDLAGNSNVIWWRASTSGSHAPMLYPISIKT